MRPEWREFEHLVVFEQQRGIVYGRWGFADHKAPRLLCLLYGASPVIVVSDVSPRWRTSRHRRDVVQHTGPRGAGKRTCGHALAKALGRRTYDVDARDALCDDAKKTEQRLQAALDDARLSDAVPVLDGFEHALVVPSDSGVLDCAWPR